MTDAETGGAPAASPTREAIRAELETTRTQYHELLNSLSDEDWKRRSGNEGWAAGQVLWHIAWGAGYFPQGVEACRKGKARNPPPWLMNPANFLITRIGSRRATPASVAAKYDAAHAAILACLDGVKDDEWQLGVKSFGRFTTIEGTVERFNDHFREHEAEIKRGLGRGVDPR
jgi:hypothetical protein